MVTPMPSRTRVMLALPLLGALLLGGCSVQRVATTPTSTTSGTPTASGTPTLTVPAGQGGLTGTVKAGPTCPVETEPPTCSPKPVANRKVNILTLDRKPVATATTDANGEFRLTLAPGTYRVEVTIVQGQVGMRQMAPVQVDVVAGKTAHVEIMLDTGIR